MNILFSEGDKVSPYPKEKVYQHKRNRPQTVYAGDVSLLSMLKEKTEEI